MLIPSASNRLRHPRPPTRPLKFPVKLGLDLICSSILLFTLGACSANERLKPPPVVAQVNLSRYLGQWYEISRLPFHWQKGCVATTATYTMREDGRLRVLNRCLDGGLEGPQRSAEGVAWVVDSTTNARLKVQFFWPFRGDYWVLALDADYAWALVGTPDYEYLWLLSRTPSLPEDLVKQILTRAQSLGYPVERMERTLQRADNSPSSG